MRYLKTLVMFFISMAFKITGAMENYGKTLENLKVNIIFFKRLSNCLLCFAGLNIYR